MVSFIPPAAAERSRGPWRASRPNSAWRSSSTSPSRTSSSSSIKRSVSKTARRSLSADAVVVNADFAGAMRRMVPNHQRKRWTDEKLAKKKFSCSTFMMYLGIDGRYDDVSHHTIYLAENYRENFATSSRSIASPRTPRSTFRTHASPIPPSLHRAKVRCMSCSPSRTTPAPSTGPKRRRGTGPSRSSRWKRSACTMSNSASVPKRSSPPRVGPTSSTCTKAPRSPWPTRSIRCCTFGRTTVSKTSVRCTWSAEERTREVGCRSSLNLRASPRGLLLEDLKMEPQWERATAVQHSRQAAGRGRVIAWPHRC